jgi:PAT family beta-lactamase induction signal transducer AmpG
MTSAAADPTSARRRQGMGGVLRALRQPRVLAMLMLGFGSGLPFMLTGNTLGFWLRDKGFQLGAISALSWVGLAYSLKFLWAPVIDRTRLPLIGRLGLRRGWMLAAQGVLVLGLLAMAAAGPTANIALFAGLALVVAFASATQDIVLDAWRIEIAEDAEELGLLTSAYQLGYRVALIVTVSWILILAQYAGWNASYAVMGLCMLAGVAATLMAQEPRGADRAMHVLADAKPLWTPRGLLDAVIGPFAAFFKAHGAFGVVMLLTITLYHLSDYLRGPVINPFYHDVGYSKVVVGLVRSSVGLWASIAGVAAGGFCSLRLGFFKTLIIGAAADRHRRLRPDRAASRPGPAPVRRRQRPGRLRHRLFRRRLGGLYVQPDQPRLRRQPIRGDEFGPGLDGQDPQGLFRLRHPGAAARPRPDARLRPVLCGRGGAGPAGDRPVLRAGRRGQAAGEGLSPTPPRGPGWRRWGCSARRGHRGRRRWPWSGSG